MYENNFYSIKGNTFLEFKTHRVINNTMPIEFKYLILLSFIFMVETTLYTADAQEVPEVAIGGALRFNYNLSSWKPAQKRRGGEFGYDLFRINAKAAYKGINLNAEYRLYSNAFGGGMLKQGWFGYHFDETNEIQLGLTQVPFGIQQYNSNNWFFNLPYYVGLEDDHDMGIKYRHTGDKVEYQLAFFKNAEETRFGNTTEITHSRYAYDVAGRNKEFNQLNGKFIYKFGKQLKHRLGVSGQYGRLFNLDTEETGNHYGLAIHYELTYNDWNIKTEAMNISNNPANAAGISRDEISMAAYGAAYNVAADFNIYTFTIARNIPVEWDPISSLKIYNDFGYMQKKKEDFDDSIMNVTGLLITAGNIYTYIDYAAGLNHSWLGGNFVDDFSRGTPEAGWEARFNVNIGYYF
ncbi:outer membrane beta barrel protein [Cyclobacterium sediminis]